MTKFAIYDLITQEIRYLSHSSETAEEVLDHWIIPNGCGLVFYEMEITDQTQWHVEAGGVLPKQPMTVEINKTTIVANGLDTAIITGFPAGATLTIRGAVDYGPEPILDEEIALTLSVAGQITVEITHAPNHLPWKVIIDAVA